MSQVLLLNGPNMAILGERQPEIYGTETLDDIVVMINDELEGTEFELISEQHDSEGGMVAALHRNRGAAGAIINPAALMIAGWSLRDALAAFPPPWVEVHLSNVWAREEFRHTSVTAPLADGIVMGMGALGYRIATAALLNIIK